MPSKYLPFVLLAGAYALAQSSAPIDNDQVKVIVAHQLPHVATALHEHKSNRVMIYLDAGHQVFNYPGKKPSALDFKAGEVMWSPGGGLHTAEITSPGAVNIVEIELKKPGHGKAPEGGAQDPVKVDPKHYKIEYENDQVRVLRVKIGPHEATPVHQHALNRVVTYVTDQDFRVTGADGKAEHTVHKAGEVSWGGPLTHKEENLSGKAFEAIVTELK